tara:strand:- start:10939 stop:11232 length:294 start_codon:yes stop_codon:yes gene_type:complete
MSEGALEYKLVEETRVNIQVSDIIEKLATIVDSRLENFYLYDEEPSLDYNDNSDSVEVYLRCDEGRQGSPCDWRILFEKAIERLAKDILENKTSIED